MRLSMTIASALTPIAAPVMRMKFRVPAADGTSSRGTADIAPRLSDGITSPRPMRPKATSQDSVQKPVASPASASYRQERLNIAMTAEVGKNGVTGLEDRKRHG